MKRRFMEKEETYQPTTKKARSDTETMKTSIGRVTRNSLKCIQNAISHSVEVVQMGSNVLKPKKNNINVKKSIPLSKCPYVDFTGEIKYYSNLNDISNASSNLNKQIEENYSNSDVIPISFDMEWPFNFKTGPSKTSVVQMSLCGKMCYIFSIGELDQIPKPLTQLLEHPKVSLYGVNIKNDLRKLERDFAGQVNSNMLVERCIDLGLMYNDIRNSSGRWSLEKLVNKLCRLQIDKSMKIRMSKWNVIPLEQHQLKYAANDVYIGHVVYQKLNVLKHEKENKKRTVIETEV